MYFSCTDTLSHICAFTHTTQNYSELFRCFLFVVFSSIRNSITDTKHIFLVPQKRSSHVSQSCGNLEHHQRRLGLESFCIALPFFFVAVGHQSSKMGCLIAAIFLLFRHRACAPKISSKHTTHGSACTSHNDCDFHYIQTNTITLHTNPYTSTDGLCIRNKELCIRAINKTNQNCDLVNFTDRPTNHLRRKRTHRET